MTVGDTKLNDYGFYPKEHKPTDKRPAIVFFFGGGWRSGTPGLSHQRCQKTMKALDAFLVSLGYLEK